MVLAALRIFGAFDLEAGRTLIRRAESLGYEHSPSIIEAGYHVHFAAGDFVRAERRFRRALAKEPHNIQVYMGLAQCAFFRGDMSGMVAEARRGLALEPNHEILGLMAAIGAVAQQGDLAALDRLRAIWEQTQVVDFAAHYSFALLHLGRVSEIEPVFQWALKEAARRRINPLQMARLCSYTGRQQEALIWLERAIRDRSTFLYLMPYARMEGVLDEPSAPAVLAPLPKSWWPNAEKPYWGQPPLTLT